MNAALTWLLDGIATIAPVAAQDTRVNDLTLDSRAVRPGSLFLALPGLKDHGLKFAAEAVARGAAAVLWEPSAELAAPTLNAGVVGAAIPALSRLAGRIADRFFGWPSSQMRITGITGTNGKTTCAYLLAQCLERLGSSAAYIGTIGWGLPEALAEPTHTTPDVVTVHRMLAQFRAAGVRDVAMEVSSHALAQGRVDAVRFHLAGFTNLTRDHLDYHGSMAAYAAAKAKLFETPELAHIVLNTGDDFGREIARNHVGRAALTAVWIGAAQSGWMAQRALHATQVAARPQGVSLTLAGSFGQATVDTRLLGRFNAENALVVLGCLLALDVPLPAAAQALSQCRSAPGRMEVLNAQASGKPTAVVDYAHTPDALSKALSAAREHCDGALWCVFGCGGDRDPGKRPLMGAIAEQLADEIIVTDDNPRSEDPQAITQAILEGIKRRGVRVIHDRSAAIGTALQEAKGRDLVLIAGKGHEDYQIYGDARRSFSDRREALRHLEAAA